MRKSPACSRSFRLAQIAPLLLATTAPASNLYWTGAGTSWFTLQNWSTSPNASFPNPFLPPVGSDIATFNIGPLNTPQTVNLNGNQFISGLVFNSTGSTLIQSGTGNNNLSISSVGITLSANAGPASITSNVSLSAAQSWTNNSPANFSLSGNLSLANFSLTYAGAGNATVGGVISGNGSLIKNGTGTLTLSNPSDNTYTGSTIVNDGTLALAANGVAIQGNLTVGDGIGAPASAVVNFVNIRQFNFNIRPDIVVNADGSLQLNSSDEVLNSITMTGGAISNVNTPQYTSNFYLAGNFTTNPSPQSATVAGHGMYLYGGGTFNIADGPAAFDLDFSAPINGATYDIPLVKQGAGTMRISSNSSFSSINLANGSLYLTGNNTFTGPITLGDNTALFLDNKSLAVINFTPNVNSQVGILGPAATVSGLQGTSNYGYIYNATSSPATLTVDNPANNVYYGIIDDGANASLALTKTGDGNFTLGGSCTFTGPLTINNGTLLFAPATFSSLTVYNNATFVYNSGPFPGRLFNAGVVIFNADFLAPNGIENDATLSIPAGRTVALNGLGLDNEGTLTLAGGYFLLSTDPTANNLNRGTINLNPYLPFALANATLKNNGRINLAAGLITGTGLLTNGPGGTITGPGAILAPIANTAGLISVPDGATNIVQPFSNAGGIFLSAPTASLTGGNITNSGFIRGVGLVGNNITNSGNIESSGGQLLLSAALTNSSAGLLRVSLGSQLVVAQGLATNAGTISLAGGTFDNNNHPLNNTGQISGFGILSVGGATGLTNNGVFTLTGAGGSGTTTINGNITNSAGKIINVQFNPALFTGNITNNGIIKITGTTVTFAGNYSGAAYISDPATNIFQQNATVTPGGQMTGSTGDVFFFNTLTNNGTFNNGGNLSVTTSITNSGTFTQTGPQSWSLGATFTNSAGLATFASNAKLAALTITAGTVDITTSKFVIEPLTSKSATLSALQSNIAAHSLISSTTPTHLGLALFDNAITQFTTFAGFPVDNNSLLLAPELLGDANIDGKVDATDLNTLLQNFGQSTPAWTSGNFDNQPTINLTDLADILNNFGLTNPNPTASPVLPTPEPASLTLLTLALPLLLRCRRPPQI